MNFFPINVGVGHKECIGCDRYDKDIMLQFVINSDCSPVIDSFCDVYLSQDDAKNLLRLLTKMIHYNEENGLVPIDHQNPKSKQ